MGHPAAEIASCEILQIDWAVVKRDYGNSQRRERLALGVRTMNLTPSALLMIWVFLLPLIPALLIFLIFPDTKVSVSGPLQGLTVRAGGAFGGYVIVLLLAIWWVGSQQKLDAARVWQVRGEVRLLDENNDVVPLSEVDERGLDVRIKPTNLRVAPSESTLGFEVPAAIAFRSNTSLELIFPGTFRRSIVITPSVDNNAVEVDPLQGEIRIRQPVELRAQPSLEMSSDP